MTAVFLSHFLDFLPEQHVFTMHSEPLKIMAFGALERFDANCFCANSIIVISRYVYVCVYMYIKYYMHNKLIEHLH